jgi:hypothetical protein
MEPVIRNNFKNLLDRIDAAAEVGNDESGFSAPFNIRIWSVKFDY